MGAVKSMANHVEELWDLIVEHDEDNDDMISETELRKLLMSKTTARVMQKMGVDVEGLVNVSGFIFEQNNGKLTKQQFLRMVLDLRGKNDAKVKDHVETRKFVRAQVFGLESRMAYLRSGLRQ